MFDPATECPGTPESIEVVKDCIKVFADSTELPADTIEVRHISQATRFAPRPNGMANQQQRWNEITRITDPLLPDDLGDHQRAWAILNLHGTPANPNPGLPVEDDFVDAVNRILALTDPSNFSQSRFRYQEAKEAVCKVLSAAKTIGRFQNRNWDISRLIQINDDDVPLGRDPWYLLNPQDTWPMAPAQQAQHEASLNNQVLVNQLRTRGPDGPTISETEHASDAHQKELLDHVPFYEGLRVDGHLDWGRFYALPTPMNGNCLWHALAYAIHGRFERAHHVKACIWKYFTTVLGNTSEPRHRTYCHLQAQSVDVLRARHPRAEALWGQLSLLRALHRNEPDAGPPMFGNFEGMLQVVADYFGVEVVVFIGPDGGRGGDPRGAWRMTAHGAPVGQGEHEDGPGAAGRYQIQLACDRSRTHYMPVRRPGEPPDDLEGYGWVDTSGVDPLERFQRMPWWTAAAAATLAGVQPRFDARVDVARDGGGVERRPPCDAPKYRPSPREEFLFENDADVPGLMPVIPAAAASWRTEKPQRPDPPLARLPDVLARDGSAEVPGQPVRFRSETAYMVWRQKTEQENRRMPMRDW